MAKVLCLSAGLAVWRSVLFAQQGPAPRDPVSADAIMARVAANQDRAEASRGRYIYIRHARVTSRKADRVLCEELTDSRVTPSATGSAAQLLQVDGRALEKGKYVTFHSLQAKNPKSDQDDVSISLGGDECEPVESMRTDLVNDKSRDGINERLFPLTSKEQAQYRFQLLGRARTYGREVFHIEFHPVDKDEYSWKGDAYIDASAFQPVVVSTTMARKLPLAVRALLGTNVPGLGFTVTYAPVEDGIWFPVSFGTEFQIKVLFFFHREITVNVENRDFEKAAVTSHMVDAAPVSR